MDYNRMIVLSAPLPQPPNNQQNTQPNPQIQTPPTENPNTYHDGNMNRAWHTEQPPNGGWQRVVETQSMQQSASSHPPPQQNLQYPQAYQHPFQQHPPQYQQQYPQQYPQQHPQQHPQQCIPQQQVLPMQPTQHYQQPYAAPPSQWAPQTYAPPLQQPAYQPIYQQPVYQQPVYQQPVYQQPVYQQPVYQQPVNQQPVCQQPVYQQLVYQQPVYQQPVYQPPAPVAQVALPPPSIPSQDPPHQQHANKAPDQDPLRDSLFWQGSQATSVSSSSSAASDGDPQLPEQFQQPQTGPFIENYSTNDPTSTLLAESPRTAFSAFSIESYHSEISDSPSKLPASNAGSEGSPSKPSLIAPETTATSEVLEEQREILRGIKLETEEESVPKPMGAAIAYPPALSSSFDDENSPSSDPGGIPLRHRDFKFSSDGENSRQDWGSLSGKPRLQLTSFTDKEKDLLVDDSVDDRLATIALDYAFRMRLNPFSTINPPAEIDEIEKIPAIAEYLRIVRDDILRAKSAELPRLVVPEPEPWH